MAALPDAIARPAERPCTVRISEAEEDAVWDAFVEKCPGGHHAQTSLWAQGKATLGWKAVRLIASRDGGIVAGAQLLVRRIVPGAAVGCVIRGPLVAHDLPGLPPDLMEGLDGLSRSRSVRLLAVQPPANGHDFSGRLSDLGLIPWHTRMGQPAATLVLDLSCDADELLSRMHAGTRHNIRLGLRRGATVCEGSDQDLPAFCRMLRATGDRQGFRPEPDAHFREVFRAWRKHGGVRLFLVMCQGEAVSGALVLAFGDTVHYKRGAWSGRHGRFRPNEVLHWGIIRWAKERGYRYYDFEGYDPSVALRLGRNQATRDDTNSVTRFKLGFGGRPVFTPGPYVRVYNPVLRRAFRLFTGTEDGRLLRWTTGRLRTAV